MENLLKELQRTSERRQQLSFENSEIKAQISDKIGKLSRSLESSSPTESHFEVEFPEHTPAVAELKEAIENLKARLRESERRCALESLRYEELLLELESSQMRQKYESVEVVGGVHSSATITSTVPPGHLEYTLPQKGTTSADTVSFKHAYPEDRQNHDCYSSKVDNFQADGEWDLSKRVSAPRGIALEKQLTHSVIVSWKPPGFLENEEEEVTAYHVYADGQFRNSVGGHEKCRALVENVDSSKQHRISIRTVTGRGQSKDAECTLLVGKGASAAPTRLKASHITTNSTKLSWLPGSSNFYHAVILNDHELRVCPPGVYKIFLTGLPPNTLHRVRVEARRTNGSSESPLNTQCPQRSPPSDDLKRNSVTIEFQTAPIGLPDPPKNVQVEAGPQDGVLLISWRPVPQATDVLPNYKNEPLVQGYTVCINDQPIIDVPGVDRDHVLLPLRQLATLLKSPEFALATQGARQHQRQHPPSLLLPHLHHSKKITTTDEGASQTDSSQSTGDSLPDLRNEDEEEGAKSDPIPKELWLTVYSTLTANTAVLMNRSSSAGEKKGSPGPASPPIKLIPNLLLLAAGSLEAAVELFGKRLSKRLGLNENNAAAACVSLRRSNPVCISIEKPGMDAERSDNADSADDDPGIVHVYAGNIGGIAKTSSPTSDALDSAEALLRERQLQKHRYSDLANQCQQHQSQYRRDAWSTDNQPSAYHPRHQREDMFHASSYHNYRHRYDMEFPAAALEAVRPLYYPRRNRPGRLLRATRSMSDENDCFGGREDPARLPYSTESTESERQKNSFHQPLFSSTKSTLDLRPEEFYRRGRHVCRWHRSSPLRQYTNSRVSLLRRSKSLGRSHNRTLISSSSNDEGISKAYFQRLQERKQSKDKFGGVEDGMAQRLSRRWHQFKVPPGAMDYSRDWNQKGQLRSEKVGKSSFEKLASKRWLQKITSVPEIHLGRAYADSDDHLRGCAHSSEHQVITDSPHSQHHFNEAMRGKQRRRRHWRAAEEEEDCLGDDDAAVMIYRLNDPDDGSYDWSEGPLYPPSLSQIRRIRPPDIVGRKPKSVKTSGRRTVSSGFEDYRMQGVERENSKRGLRRRFQSEVRNQTPDRRPLSSPSLRPTGAGDGCVFFVSLYDYDPATMSPNPGAADDELPFREGDIIKVYGDCDEDGFYFGECNGRKGFVPSNMVCEAGADEVAEFLRRRVGHHGRSGTAASTGLPPGQMTKSHHTVTQPSGPPEPSASLMEQNFGCYHYPHHGGRTSRDCQVRGKDRRTRLQGSTCAEEKQIAGGRLETTNRKRAESQKSRHCVMEALYDYDPHIYSPNVDVETELKFRAGDRILILSEMDEDGFYVGQLESSGRRGLVPSNFLRKLPCPAGGENADLINFGASDGGDAYESRSKKAYAVPSGGSKLSHVRGAGGNRSTLRSDDADLGPVSRQRRSPGRARERISKQLSRSRVRADNHEDVEGEEEDSMITSTVPPPNSSDWPDGPPVSVKLHSGVPLSTTSTATNATVTPTLGPPKLTNLGSNCDSVGTGGGDEGLPKDSPDSDGQGGVIIMDINSKKHSKSRKSALSRNSSNEQSQDHGPGYPQSRRRSVFRSPFKKIPHAIE